eukprot:GSChrysophyteH1.ASY1.ANO1.282.1 assembled CDS
MPNPLESLEQLALISKVCTDLDRHLGFSDKTLAEYIIHLAKDARDHSSFHDALKENGADFPSELSQSLLIMIQSELKPKEIEHSSFRDRKRQRSPNKDSQNGEPELYGIYDGKVSNVTDFGCFVELLGFSGRSKKYEGLCHIAQIQKERVTDIRSVVKKGQLCKVKVISLVGQKMSVSIKEVDQSTGTDLLPESSSYDSNTNRPIDFGIDIERLRQQEIDEERKASRRQKKLSAAELWESRQLIASGAVSVTERPTFDAESGLGAIQDVEPDEDIDVEINEEEPPFLRGQTRGVRDVEPVKIVKNPDGSMQRAAISQAELSKERKELKRAAQNDLIDAIPKDLSKPWNDPMPEQGERHFAQELRSINVGKGLAYGQISSKSIREQREGLPVFSLKSQLMNAITQNQVLVVIGETGSVAATSVSKRVAEDIRFDDMTSPVTKIKYMTDGMLMREYLADNLLSKYICIILDEAHERTIHTDVLFGLLKKLLKEPEPDYLEASMTTVMQIHLTEPAGDILLFLTGQEEIDTLYSALPSEMQSRIFEPAPLGSRKVLGMDSLVVTPISAASAKQRAGRAGRTGPGKCYRLYTEAAFETEMMQSSVPEIQRTNLGNVVLQLKAMGINDLIGFDFMDPPPVQTLVAAMEALYVQGALDDEGLLTRLGRKMAEFPLEPSLSKMLIISAELGCSEEILTIVAMLSVEPPWYRPKEKAGAADQKKAKFNQAEGDHLTFMKRAQDVRTQLITIMDKYSMDIVSAGKNLDPQEGYKTIQDQNVVYIHPSSSLFNKSPEWVLYHELVLTTKEYMRNILSVEAKWLVEMAPKFFKKSDPTQLSKTKRKEKIEPLHDRFHEKDEWRLSKRRF